MKKKIRAWLVRNFVLGTWVKVAGKTFHTQRAARVIWPVIVLVGLVVVTDPKYPAFQWWDALALGILTLALWMGFNFFNLGYFGFFPVKYQELDLEQQHDYLRGIKAGVLKNPELEGKYGPLTPAQAQEFRILTTILEKKYQGNFAGLKNLLPLAASLVLVVVWYVWIYDMLQL